MPGWESVLLADPSGDTTVMKGVTAGEGVARPCSAWRDHPNENGWEAAEADKAWRYQDRKQSTKASNPLSSHTFQGGTSVGSFWVVPLR